MRTQLGRNCEAIASKTMNLQIVADGSDFARLAKAFAKLPDEIRATVARRALREVEQRAKTQIVRRSSERIKAPVRKIAERVATVRLTDDLEFRVRSEWLRLIDLGARQTRSGVSVRMRGSYKSAFIATMNSTAVFKREGRARGPVDELFGPNPASDMVNHPATFEDVLADVIEAHLVPRALHAIDRLLPR